MMDARECFLEFVPGLTVHKDTKHRLDLDMVFFW